MAFNHVDLVIESSMSDPILYRVLLAIAHKLNKDSESWDIPYKTLIGLSRCSKHRAIEAVRNLENQGILKVTRHYDPASRNNYPNTYSIDWDRFNELYPRRKESKAEKNQAVKLSPSTQIIPSVQNDTRYQNNPSIQNLPSVQKDITPSVVLDTTPSVRNDTTPSTQNDTPKSNIQVNKQVYVKVDDGNTAEADVTPTPETNPLLTKEKENEIIATAESNPKKSQDLQPSLFGISNGEQNASRHKKGERFKFDFESLSDGWRSICRDLRPDLDADTTFKLFRYYCTVGKGAEKYRTERGWNQAWLNWVKLEKESSIANGKSQQFASSIQYPIEKIVDLYHQELPSLSKVGILDDSMRANGGEFYRILGEYCKSHSEQESLAGIKRFFNYCSKSDFLMGRVQRVNGNPVWRANFAWIINPKNTINIINGNYENQ